MSYNAPPPPGYGPPGGYGQPGGYGGYGGPPAGTNTKAIASLVLSIAGFLCCGPLLSIPGIIVGFMAKSEVQRTGQAGLGLAKAGIILGIIQVIFTVVYAVLVATGTVEGFSFNFSAGS